MLEYFLLYYLNDCINCKQGGDVCVEQIDVSFGFEKAILFSGLTLCSYYSLEVHLRRNQSGRSLDEKMDLPKVRNYIIWNDSKMQIGKLVFIYHLQM